MAQYFSKSEMFTNVKSAIDNVSNELLYSVNPKYSIEDCIVTVYHGKLWGEFERYNEFDAGRVVWYTEYYSKGSKPLKDFRSGTTAIDFIYNQISGAELMCKVVITTYNYETLFTKSKTDLEFKWDNEAKIIKIKNGEDFVWEEA